MSMNRGLPLSRCHRLLAASIEGHAPSLIALRRHAKAGELADCQVVSRGKRPRYDPERLKDRYRQWSESARQTDTGRSATDPARGLLQLRPEQVEEIARLIAASLSPELSRLQKLASD